MPKMVSKAGFANAFRTIAFALSLISLFKLTAKITQSHTDLILDRFIRLQNRCCDKHERRVKYNRLRRSVPYLGTDVPR